MEPLAARRRGHPGEAVVSRLGAWSLLVVEGSAARRFLQAQLTADLDQVDARRARIAAWCSPRGRALAVMLVAAVAEERFVLRLPAALADTVRERLRMYVLRADVRIEAPGEALGHLGVAGAAAGALVDRVGGGLDGAALSARTGDGVTVVRLPGVEPRLELFGERDAVDTLATQAAGATDPTAGTDDAGVAGTDSRWHGIEVCSGLPAVYPQTADQFVPQMLNLDLLGAVSFDKGCFPGQEVVARAHHLGRVKRRMRLARISRGAGDAAPAPGERVHASSGGEAAGTVVDAAPADGGGHHALLVLPLDTADELRTGAGDPISLATLPYPLPD